MRTTSLFLALVVGALGCTREEPAEPVVSPAGGVRWLDSGRFALGGDLEGCVVEVRDDLPTSIAAICYVDGGGTSGPAVAGKLLSVSGNDLWVGGRRYGPLASTSRVVIDADGVHADGVLLGPLP